MLSRIGPLAWDFLALYGLQVGNFLIPLLTFPVLARALTPDSWAGLLAAQALAIAVATVVEYGHNITATRRIAATSLPVDMLKIVRLVYVSKGLLASACLFLCGLAFALGWNHRPLNASLILSGVAFGLFQGSLPTWYFQGRQQARVAASVDMTFKGLAGLGMVIIALSFARPEPVLWIQLGGVAITWALLTRRLVSDLGIELWHGVPLREVGHDLREGFAVFIFRLLGSSYTSALALILAAVVPPLSSALILTADRMAKVMPTLTVPFCQALYPRIVTSGSYATPQGVRRIFLSAIKVFAALLIGSVVLYLLREPAVAFLVGEKYAAAADIMAVTVWLMPFIGFNTVLFNFWVFPARRDAIANALLVVNALISLGWVLFMAGRTNLPLYTFGISAAEVVISGVLMLLVLRNLRYLLRLEVANA
ncbi:oligosaccharide flippase family protein [Deinococcus deserti]|uniref:Putative polysaccharide biosynthesis protein putative membrane protein n=1 Tax=Deinococcus deserti (strain DSM 17065 / CIP 109153 / LMG 22923 / VCD115) TaxID=546414 RepID=C1CYL4_DEIDV|nr:oligosaccharide flippase family protein [Deinococcus deserti]ACO47044.1 putative polysaccharide biosynthesis protein; putative membrane protein [Deinococcus deserti VCD115]